MVPKACDVLITTYPFCQIIRVTDEDSEGSNRIGEVPSVEMGPFIQIDEEVFVVVGCNPQV